MAANRLTRRMLGEFLNSPETIKAFESLDTGNSDLEAIVTQMRDAAVLVLSLTDAFTNQRVVTSDGEVEVTDGGPGGNLTFGLSDTGVTPNTYGSASQLAQVAVNAKGRITLASSVPLNSDNATEGSLNLYFTTARARSALSGGAGISYNSTTGQIAASAKLAAYDGGDTPSAFVLSIVDAVDDAAFRAAIGAGTGGGSVTSVAASVPTGFSISGSPITTNGTMAISFAAGYSLPTNASQADWSSAYSWGDHAAAGYASASRTLTAGSGLTGGGDLSANRSFAIDTGVVVTLTGSQTLSNKTLSAPAITQTPTYGSAAGANHLADTSSAAQSLANGATVDFPLFSGLVIVNDHGGGGVGAYLCGGNNVLQLGASQTIGGTLAFNGGITGYTFTNTSGGTRTFSFASIMTRSFS